MITMLLFFPRTKCSIEFNFPVTNSGGKGWLCARLIQGLHRRKFLSISLRARLTSDIIPTLWGLIKAPFYSQNRSYLNTSSAFLPYATHRSPLTTMTGTISWCCDHCEANNDSLPVQWKADTFALAICTISSKCEVITMEPAEDDIISSALQKRKFPNRAGCGREDLLCDRRKQNRILIQISNLHDVKHKQSSWCGALWRLLTILTEPSRSFPQSRKSFLILVNLYYLASRVNSRVAFSFRIREIFFSTINNIRMLDVQNSEVEDSRRQWMYSPKILIIARNSFKIDASTGNVSENCVNEAKSHKTTPKSLSLSLYWNKQVTRR